ncbi:MAG TPA: methyltransferase domain-containing protein [Paenirhodobacter sp.]
MGFFDFLPSIARYEDDANTVQRMNLRHEMIIAPLVQEIAGARVLDLAAHDGRWSYAFATAGAREVVGIEGRADLVARFDCFPANAARDRVSLICDDIFDAMEKRVARGETFDVIGILGIFYHIMDHFRLLRLAAALKPRLMIVDSEFAARPGAVILMSRERTDKDINAIPQIAGQARAVVGIPSPKALESMADALDLSCTWLDWQEIPEEYRKPVADYYRVGEKRRGTCLLHHNPVL